MAPGFHGGRTVHPGLQGPGVVPVPRVSHQVLIVPCSGESQPLAAGGPGSLAQGHGAGGTTSLRPHATPPTNHCPAPSILPPQCMCLNRSDVPASFLACSAPQLPHCTLVLAKSFYSSSQAWGWLHCRALPRAGNPRKAPKAALLLLLEMEFRSQELESDSGLFCSGRQLSSHPPKPFPKFPPSSACPTASRCSEPGLGTHIRKETLPIIDLFTTSISFD